MNMKRYERYETYAPKRGWQASYNSQLGDERAFGFASDCAEHCNGMVFGVTREGDSEEVYTSKNFGKNPRK